MSASCADVSTAAPLDVSQGTDMVCTGQGSHVKQTIATINHVHASNWPPCPWPTDLSQISMPSTAQVHENSWNFGLGFVLLLLLSTHARTNTRTHALTHACTSLAWPALLVETRGTDVPLRNRAWCSLRETQACRAGALVYRWQVAVRFYSVIGPAVTTRTTHQVPRTKSHVPRPTSDYKYKHVACG